MTDSLNTRMWSRQHLRSALYGYMAVSADVSPWTAENFFKELPGKWDLSFGVWNDQPIGYCVMSLRDGGVHIHQFMVAREHRGKGIGAGMLKRALALASARAELITLKVPKPSIPAQKFYTRHGFTVAGEDDSHVLMSRKLIT